MPLAVSWPGRLDILPKSKAGEAGSLAFRGGQGSDVQGTQLPGDSLQGHWGASPSPRTMADPWKGRPVLLTPFNAQRQGLLGCQ